MDPMRSAGFWDTGTIDERLGAEYSISLQIRYGRIDAPHGLDWYEAVLGLVVLPGLMLMLSLPARRRGSGPLRLPPVATTGLH
jgi:hypothetical protein